MRAERDRIRPLCKARGAALIVALLLLLVLTILGVSAMSSSTMQGLMASSYEQQTSTLARVENVLLEGEREVEDLVAIGIPSPVPSYFRNLQEIPIAPQQFAVGTMDWTVGAVAAAQMIGDFAIPGRFVIEYMGEFEVPGESIAVGGAFEDSRIHIFRVSARGEETQRGGLRIVQSLYVTLRGPDGL